LKRSTNCASSCSTCSRSAFSLTPTSRSARAYLVAAVLLVISYFVRGARIIQCAWGPTPKRSRSRLPRSLGLKAAAHLSRLAPRLAAVMATLFAQSAFGRCTYRSSSLRSEERRVGKECRYRGLLDVL